MKRVIAYLALAACGGDDGPCSDRSGACVAITIEGEVGRIDQLEVDLLYGGQHRTTSSRPSGGATGLPVELAIAIDVSAETRVGIVAAGKLSGNVLGTGSVSVMLDANIHAAETLVLAAPDACTAGSLYCGGDKVAGDPGTLYECNGGGVPLARGVCVGACAFRPGDDDICRGAGGCVEGSDYCGGDKLDGDPQVLYRCTAGVGTNPRPCTDGCIIKPGDDDRCR